MTKFKTGFEVGKKYMHSSGMRVRTVEYVSPSGVALAIDDETGKAVAYNNFSDYKEYIPPPPEEWRIVYKDKFGNVTVGNIPFKSESEANASQFWTDHSTAFKTIRVDA